AAAGLRARPPAVEPGRSAAAPASTPRFVHSDTRRAARQQVRGVPLMSAPDPVDVLIVGSGMAGAAIAKRLSERGLRVVCLEQGPWVGAEEHPHYSNEWEFETLRRWNRNPNDRHAPADFPVTGNDINPLLYNA